MLLVVLCCRGRTKTGRLDLGEQKGEDLLAVTLFSGRYCMWFSRGCLRELVTLIQQQVVRREWSVRSTGGVGRRKGRLQLLLLQLLQL